MKLLSKLMALSLAATLITQANGMQRALKAANVTSTTASRILGTRLVLKSPLNTVPKRSSKIAAPIKTKPQPAQPFVTAAWRKFTLKKNDPVQLESDIRTAITENSEPLLQETVRNNAELIARNNNQFVRAPNSVPYLTLATGQLKELNQNFIRSLIGYCPNEMNESYYNPRTHASGCRLLSYANHEYPTPLSVAIQHHHYNTAATLLDHGADANTTLGHPDYPNVLAYAVKRCEKQLVRKLLERGAYIRYAGYDALATARRNYHLYGTSYEADVWHLIEEFDKRQTNSL